MKYYTTSHEWCDLKSHKVGISDFAKKELGDVVYLQLPKLHQKVLAGQELCILESTKAAADVYAPYDGVVSELNHEAINSINEDPEGRGWLVKITPSSQLDTKTLLSPQDYHKMLVS
jgi:glycine cleavage system H protein